MRRKPEAAAFRVALLHLRHGMKVNQDWVAARLGVSRRTLSTWECGRRLPSFKERLHIVLALRDAPPEHVLALADALGVSADPAAETFLQPMIDAVEGPDSGAAPPAPAAPPRVPVPTEVLRAHVEGVVHRTADALDVRANDLRRAVDAVLAAAAEKGATVEETRAAIAVAGGGGPPRASGG